MEWPKITYPRTPPQAVFIRFGLWSPRSYNAMTRVAERGVSVYRARMVDEVVSLDDEISSQLYGEGRCIFPVTGNLVGYGSDGEPVLRAVKCLPYAIDFASIPEQVKR